MAKDKKQFVEWLWDSWCVVSLLGIWPRYIEPNLLKTRRISLALPKLPEAFSGLKIAHFSDLHFSSKTSTRYLKKIVNKISALQPDIIAFTGDFLCFSKLEDEKRLLSFLQALPKAPLGNFAVLGNHDYSEYVTVNEEGSYEVLEKKEKTPTIIKGLRRIFSPLKPSGVWKTSAHSIAKHEALFKLLEKSPFTLLHNKTVQVEKDGQKINISGFGEYMMQQIDIAATDKNFMKGQSSIALVHNPDGIVKLSNFPADLILSGHTHGGQINLPIIRNNFIVMENPRFCKGLIKEKEAYVYISSGVGGVLPFRWFCLPEITLITLTKDTR